MGMGSKTNVAVDGAVLAAQRLDDLLENWPSRGEGALTELVRIRGLLGVPVSPPPSGIGNQAPVPGDDLLAAAAQRLADMASVAQSYGGSAQEIVVLNRMAKTMRAWLAPYDRSARNAALRDNAVRLAEAVLLDRAHTRTGV
jgi:hypothetical protein